MHAFLMTLEAFMESLLAPLLPSGIEDKLTFVYEKSILVMGIGCVLLLGTLVAVIVTVIRVTRLRDE